MDETPWLGNRITRSSGRSDLGTAGSYQVEGRPMTPREQTTLGSSPAPGSGQLTLLELVTSLTRCTNSAQDAVRAVQGLVANRQVNLRGNFRNCHLTAC